MKLFNVILLVSISVALASNAYAFKEYVFENEILERELVTNLNRLVQKINLQAIGDTQYSFPNEWNLKAFLKSKLARTRLDRTHQSVIDDLSARFANKNRVSAPEIAHEIHNYFAMDLWRNRHFPLFADNTELIVGNIYAALLSSAQT